MSTFCPECGGALTVMMTSRSEEYIEKARIRHGCGSIIFWHCPQEHIWVENQLGMCARESNFKRLYSRDEIFTYRGL